MASLPEQNEPNGSSGPLGAARGILLAMLLSSVLWIGLAITLRMLGVRLTG